MSHSVLQQNWKQVPDVSYNLPGFAGDAPSMIGLTAERGKKVIALNLHMRAAGTPAPLVPTVHQAAESNGKRRHIKVAQGISPGSAHGRTSVSLLLQTSRSDSR